MNDNVRMKISIPVDQEGFILQKCSLCGEKFKLSASAIQEDYQVWLWCPNCGISGQSFIDDEVIELAENMAINKLSELINDFSKDMEKHFRNGPIKFKAQWDNTHEATDQIVSKTENLEIKKYLCCKKEAKISPNLKFEGSYCPYCGEMTDGDN